VAEDAAAVQESFKSGGSVSQVSYPHGSVDKDHVEAVEKALKRL
jgi:hypothetical protein